MTVPTFTVGSPYVSPIGGAENRVKSTARYRILNPLRLPFRHLGQPFNYNRLRGESKDGKYRFRHWFRHSRSGLVLFYLPRLDTKPDNVGHGGAVAALTSPPQTAR